MSASRTNLPRFSPHLWLALGMFVVFAASFVVYAWSEWQVDRANESRHLSYLLADELRQSSDDLTRMVRAYVVTGDTIYRQHYQEILDIRDGRKPRPVTYQFVYWDLVLADIQQPGPAGPAVPLLELMRRAGFTEEEFAKLADAKANSDALTRTEFAAMNVIDSADPPAEASRVRAIATLYDAAYRQAKAGIMRPIGEFQRLTDQRTLAAVEDAMAHATRMRLTFIVFGLVLVFLLWRAQRNLHAILGGSVDDLHGRIAELGSGKFSRAIPVAKGMENSVLGWLAQTQVNLAAADERLRLDIAERERVEAQLRDTETSFRYLFEKNPNPMWVFDRENLAFLEVNDAAVAHYGYSHEEFRQLRITDLRPSEDVPRLLTQAAKRPDGFRESGEWRHITKDGRIIDVDIASFYLEFKQRAAALVVARDTTESKRAREALKASEAAARSVLDSALDAYIRMNEQGRITAWNTMAEKTFGWTRSEAIDQPLADLIIPPDQQKAHLTGLKRYLESGEGPILNRRTEVQALHRSGKTLPVEITVLPIEKDSGRDFSAFVRDLTGIKRAEAQFLQAQKMEAVGLLTGGVAHDFNNLLTVIIGNLEHALASGSTGSRHDEIIADALSAAEKGSALTHRLLAFSRQQPLQPVHTDLNAIVTGMIVMLRRTLGEDIEIEVKLDKQLWPELADTSQVENALLNLAINAREAMPAGGKLTIETLNTSLDESYTARNADVRPGDYVMLAITDTGAGMPPEIIERVFQPFFTTKVDGMGSGLGLSMIYGFARQSGGHVTIYSEVGHGTTVRLYLPRAPSSAEPPAPASDVERAPEGSAGNEAILVVEDDASVRKLVVANLGQLGYRVLEAADGAAALKLLRGDANIDLLFTDVILPGGMNGRELADESRRLRPGLRVLFTSGYTQNSIVHQGKLDEGVHLLSKPYRREELSGKVREVLGFLDQDE